MTALGSGRSGLRGAPSRGSALLGWTALCASAEAIGMTAAALAAKLSQQLLGQHPHGRETALALAVVVAGGLVEGVALGAMQAWGLRWRVPGLNLRRWVLITTAVAGLGWAVASIPGVLADDDSGGSSPPPGVVVLGALALGAVMGTLLGAAQASVLRDHARRPGRWILANAMAWPPAMAVIFVGATTPDGNWPVATVALLGAGTGLAAGAVLGLVTGCFLTTSLVV
ncbi:MAG: hypothetical protein WAW17_25690 [Rhodococcus sp. (in: high G+C Gram-positive bacteria)]|uniref:hypothetical protein n=1 Tax=Rhodococcus sp. TaxID=1831 RepID=UPI003BB17864